jgi:hypothetical protein
MAMRAKRNKWTGLTILFSWYHPAGNGTWRQCFSKLASRWHLPFSGTSSNGIMDLQHDYENEHEKATSELALDVRRLANFELLLTSNGISAGIAA